MALEDFIDLNASSASVSGTENNEAPNSDCVISEPDPQPSKSRGTKDAINGEIQGRDDVANNEDQVTEDSVNDRNQGRESVIDEESQGRASLVNDEELEKGQCIGGNMEGQQTQHTQDMEVDKDLFEQPLVMQESIIVAETFKMVEKVDNGFAVVRNDIDISYSKIDDRLPVNFGRPIVTPTDAFYQYANFGYNITMHAPICCFLMVSMTSHALAISGVKRKRVEYADQEPSVRVIYNSLTSASKRKLEELLQQWSKWNAQHDSSTNVSLIIRNSETLFSVCVVHTHSNSAWTCALSTDVGMNLNQKPHENLVSGEETYFPALQVGTERSSAVSFWMDDDTRKEQTEEIIRVDGDSAPLYDRGFLLGLTSMDGPSNVEGGLEAVEASRCFNCSSYNHALKDCPKPRDHTAVNNARKEHNSKKNQTSGPHKNTRYYESSSGGKYDGLRPGFLGTETRQLLGIGELDPPPWLHRMREIGYPPGYMDLDDEDQASGIKIYLDEKTRIDQEDGELSETDEPEQPEQKKKMSVEFPGINAPIPKNADERRWAALPAVSSFDPYRNAINRFNPSPSHSSEANYRGHFSDQRRPRDYRDDGHYSDQRRSRDYRDDSHYSDQRRPRDYRDDAPPGCNPEAGISPFIPSYRSPNLGRSLSDRGRWNPSGNGDSSNQSPYESLQHSGTDSHRSGSGHKQLKRRFTEGP
ncbi:hypothetical protein C5167_005649 [Papaver somniferum]|uniref:CCHC-type domain-containing protein n=1 Tax=Papaver somniferum TaxID=3469 RepID=A0A4Y7JE68_PAPSO|nr:hypothetical protein C5167_005649 [Papaver somniferum]